MATNLSSTVSLALNWTFTNPLDLTTPRDSGALALTLADLANGTGANAVNTIWHDQRTLLTTVSENIDVFDFGGGTPSPLGTAISNAKVAVVLIQNTHATDALTIGGEGSAAAWNSPFGASDTAKMTIPAGGTLLLVAPSAAGYAVADASNHLLKIDNPGANSVIYKIVILGATA